MAEQSIPQTETPKYTAHEQQMIKLLGVHHDVVMRGRATENQIHEGAKALMDATSVMLRDGSRGCFDIMWEYQNQYKTTACAEVNALKGFNRFSQFESQPAALVYNAFRAVINKITWGSYDAALVRFQGGPALVDYLASKTTK